MVERPNWRDIPVIELTDEEVAQMSPEEQRWCSDLLFERHQRSLPAIEADQQIDSPATFDPSEIDRAEFAFLADGRRIRVYPGEGADEQCFAGELLNPTKLEMRGQGHISCMWDRSKVTSLEFSARATPKEQADG